MLLKVSQLVFNYDIFGEIIFSARKYDLEIEVEEKTWEEVIERSYTDPIDAGILLPCLQDKGFEIFNIQRRNGENVYIIHLQYDFTEYEKARNLDGIELMFYKLKEEGWNFYCSVFLDKSRDKILELFARIDEDEDENTNNSIEEDSEEDEDEDEDEDNSNPVEDRIGDKNEDKDSIEHKNQIKLDDE